jgi:hypothetical protein
MASILSCFGCAGTKTDVTDYQDEKAALLSAHGEPRKAELVANDVVDTILHTKLTGLALQMKLDSVVGAYGWKENVAKWVLEKLTRALEEGHEKLGPAVRDAYHKAVEVAMTVEGFVVEHPVFCTVVALGVLALMSPWLLPLLGFAEEGIIEGMGNLLYFRWTGTDKCYRFIRCMVAVHVRWLRPQGLTVLIPSASGYDAALAWIGHLNGFRKEKPSSRNEDGNDERWMNVGLSRRKRTYLVMWMSRSRIILDLLKAHGVHQ